MGAIQVAPRRYHGSIEFGVAPPRSGAKVERAALLIVRLLAAPFFSRQADPMRE